MRRRTSPPFSGGKAEKFKAPEKGGTGREGGPAGGQCKRRRDQEHGWGCLTHLGSGVTLLSIVKVSPSFSSVSFTVKINREDNSYVAAWLGR